MRSLEYPEFTSGLHLVMIMHEMLEEVQARGVVEPRLEFHENSRLIVVRAAEWDDQDELDHRDAGADEPLRTLRSLRSEGYIELDDDDELPTGASVITITDKGLEKIRQWRTLHENMPRPSKLWTIPVLQGPQIGTTRYWRAEWEGHEIQVTNSWRLHLRRRQYIDNSVRESLDFSDRYPPRYRVENYRMEKSRFSKDLYGEFHADDGVHEVRAHIGLTSPFLKTGCLIGVDGVVIGGDVYKKFLT